MIVSPLAVLFATLGVVCFVRGFRRLRPRRPDYAGWSRAALFGAAVAVGLVASSASVGTRADDSLAAHMLEHVLIGDVVPALSLVALRGPLLFFVVPQFLLRAVAASKTTRAVLVTLTRPLVAFSLWVGGIALWHIPSLYDSALTNTGLHVFEHGVFFVTGLLAWIQIVDPARRGSLSAMGRLGFVVGMFAVGQVLAVAFVSTRAPLYPSYAEGDRVFGLSPISDQRYAASVMMAEQMLVLSIAAVFLLQRHFQELAETTGQEDSQAPAHAA